MRNIAFEWADPALANAPDATIAFLHDGIILFVEEAWLCDIEVDPLYADGMLYAFIAESESTTSDHSLWSGEYSVQVFRKKDGAMLSNSTRLRISEEDTR